MLAQVVVLKSPPVAVFKYLNCREISLSDGATLKVNVVFTDTSVNNFREAL
jgi:hypothetical protein